MENPAGFPESNIHLLFAIRGELLELHRDDKFSHALSEAKQRIYCRSVFHCRSVQYAVLMYGQEACLMPCLSSVGDGREGGG